MYKDKDKQREANKQAMRRKRAASVIPCDTRLKVIPSNTPIVIPCEVERTGVNLEALNIAAVPNGHGGHKLIAPIPKRGKDEGVTINLPEQPPKGAAVLEVETESNLKSKRGKDIKCFEDLPPDVQRTIRSVSESNEEFQKRTEVAIKYQHLFPDRYHSTGARLCQIDRKDI